MSVFKNSSISTPLSGTHHLSPSQERISQYEIEDPFRGSPIKQQRRRLSSHYKQYDYASFLKCNPEVQKDLVSVPRSDHAIQDTLAALRSSSPSSSLAPLLERIQNFEITETTFSLLHSIDPTFWSLETYIQTCLRASVESKDILPLCYYASLLGVVRPVSAAADSTYYYEKSSFVRNPRKVSNMLQDALASVQQWINHNDSVLEEEGHFGTDPGSPSTTGGYSESTHNDWSASTKTSLSSSLLPTQAQQRKVVLDELKSTVARLIFNLDHMQKNMGDVESYQACLWPNASSISKLIHHLPQFDTELPVQLTAERAQVCLNAFLPQLEGLMGDALDLFERVYLYQDPVHSTSSPSGATSTNAPFWVKHIVSKVEAWRAAELLRENESPRKRSFDYMDHDVISQFRRPLISPPPHIHRPRKFRRPSETEEMLSSPFFY